MKRGNLSFRTQTLPLRLIDLPATLASRGGGVHFADATDWSFHVISHTWSQDIREFSVTIGGILGRAEQSRVTYNQCFADAQLAGNEAYENLMDFFRVVEADGARRVWFDALCINQADDREKEREICNMGAYYHLSAGCYVVTHGIGTEAGFKALDSTGAVPRWFTRVWTYQEGVLPAEKLMFLVERFDGPMRACLEENRDYLDTEAMWVDWDEELKQEWDPTGSETFYRRRIGGAAGKEVYVLGAQAYWRMMTAALLVREQVLRDLPRSALDDFHQAFGQLGVTREYTIDVEAVVRAIRRRECTVGEDRVLGMVGLFGFEGELQLRTKQTLEQQLLWLARTLMAQQPQLVVNLCAADFEGNHGIPRASWLPDLRHRKLSIFEKPSTGFGTSLDVVRGHSARAVELREDGAVVLRAHAVQGACSLIRLPLRRFSAKDRAKYGKDHADPLIRLQADAHPAFHIDFCYPPDDQLHAGVLRIAVAGDPFALHGGLSIPAAPSIHKLRDHNHPSPYTICRPLLLALGQNELGRCVAMLCVTADAHRPQLHKLGIVHADPLLSEHFMAILSPDPHDFTIGGFGNNLTPCLTTECQEILQTLTTGILSS